MKQVPNPTRRQFVATVTGAAAALASAPLVGASVASAQNSRRIIWNNDGDDLRFMAFGIRRLWTARDPADVPLPERFSSLQEFLDLRMTALRTLPVDTITYCGIFNWPAWEMPRDRIAAIGEDPIKPIIEFTRSAGKDFFFNIRMNDCHSSLRFHGAAWWEPFRARNLHLLQSAFTAEDLEKKILPWVRGETQVSPVQDVIDRRGPGNRDIQSWSAYDYARPEVRQYFLGLIREVCQRYDVDGVDLDWLRHPFFFRLGEERKGIPIMNDFVRRVADAVRLAGRRRGRPIIISMRVPDTPDRAQEIGLDVPTWISEGWVDMIVASNGLTCFSTPVQPWLDLARLRNIPVYGCITRNAPGLSDPAALCGASQRWWESGVAGLYFFNHFIPAEYNTILDSADRERLSGRTKTYLVDVSYTRSQNGTVHSGPLPLDFSTCAGEASVELQLYIPESLKGARERRIAVQWRGERADVRSRWSINGEPASARQQKDFDGLTYDGRGLKQGLNSLRVTVSPATNGSRPSLLLQSVGATVVRA